MSLLWSALLSDAYKALDHLICDVAHCPLRNPPSPPHPRLTRLLIIECFICIISRFRQSIVYKSVYNMQTHDDRSIVLAENQRLKGPDRGSGSSSGVGYMHRPSSFPVRYPPASYTGMHYVQGVQVVGLSYLSMTCACARGNPKNAVA